MMMMKSSITLVTCALLFSSLAVLANQGSFSPDSCCLEFFPTRLRKDRVVSYKSTDKRCSMDGVIFKMKNGVELCVDPKEPWVKSIVTAKQKVLAN